MQQNWHDKDPEIWHVQWKRDGKNSDTDFDTVNGKPPGSVSTAD
jgi:hypothetical protein